MEEYLIKSDFGQKFLKRLIFRAVRRLAHGHARPTVFWVQACSRAGLLDFRARELLNPSPSAGRASPFFDARNNTILLLAASKSLNFLGCFKKFQHDFNALIV